MSSKPFRNSKGVNKPFCSPFNNATPNDSTTSNVNTPKSSTHNASLKLSASKKMLFKDTPSPKKFCINKENNKNQIGITQNTVLCHNDLELLRKRIQEKQESVNNLKRSLLYKKKNKAEDLEDAIKKWTSACQNALRDYQSGLQEKNGQPVTISEILCSLNIDPNTVQFSIDDDIFW